MNLLIIIISLILGFLQGLRFRKKKIRKEIIVLNDEINNLKQLLKKEQRKNRLSMFHVNQKMKGDQSKLEEQLVEYFSKSDLKNNFNKMKSLFQYLIDNWENEFLNAEDQIRIVDLNLAYNKFYEIDRTMIDPVSIKFRIDSSRNGTVTVSDFFPSAINLLKEIKIEQYDISYMEFLDAMLNVSEILYE